VALEAKLETARQLQALGLCRAEYTPMQLVNRGAVNVFLPHGLGHHLGLQVRRRRVLGPVQGRPAVKRLS
jgi:hypothetical protein